MYAEFIYPSCCRLADEFGLLYYGCCEPVHGIFEKYISRMSGLRKVSVSRWSDEDIMGSLLKERGVIYSRKPDPAFLSEGRLDEDAFSKSILKTLKAADGCPIEFIYRDVYKLDGDRTKPGRAVSIMRDTIERYKDHHI
jgi:hypothetical protein